MLRDDLVVTAYYDNGTSAVVTTYTLSGTLTVGTSVITAAYGGKTATFNVTVTQDASSEIISTFLSYTRPNATTFENETESNTWTTAVGAILANKVSLTWDTTECDLFQIIVYQYDANGDPYEHTGINRYASDPVTDGAIFDTDPSAWAAPGTGVYFTAIAGGNIAINLPTSGLFKVCLRRSSGTGSEVTDNASFGTWLNNGGVTITAYR